MANVTSNLRTTNTPQVPATVVPSSTPEYPSAAAAGQTQAGPPSAPSQPRTTNQSLLQATQNSQQSDTAERPDAQRKQLILVGGGPRTSTQATAEVQFLVDHRQDFENLQSMGARYNIKTTIVEKQDSSSIGRGNAFTADHSGMVNTGVEGKFTTPTDAGPQSQETANLTNYSERFMGRFGQNHEAFAEELGRSNTPGKVMYDRAARGGALDISRATQSRSQIGEEEHDTFNKARELAKDIPFYDLEVLADTEATKIDLSDEKQPSVEIRRYADKSAKRRRLTADQVRLNTGTTTASPVRDPDVKELTFSQPMNPKDSGEFFQQRNLLDENGKLKPGVKVLSGGTSLSGLDQLSVLDQHMDLFEPDENDPVGYRVTDSAKANRQGAIAIVSNTAGKHCHPRNAHGLTWTADTQPAGSPAGLHALFLHKRGEEVFGAWGTITDASIARALGTTPDKVDPTFETTREAVAFQAAETAKHLAKVNEAAELREADPAAADQKTRESTQTLYGHRRQAGLGTLLGLGLSPNPEETTSEMSERAPYTWKGRQGYLMHRAQAKGISEPSVASLQSNQTQMKRYDSYMADVMSSPAEIHAMTNKLMEAGVAVHIPGGYQEVKASPSGNGLTFKGENYDAFVVSPTFNRSADPAVKSLEGQVKPIHPDAPGFGETAHFRQLITVGGEVSHVEDYGLGGKGTKIRTPDGKRTTIGVVAFDTNNRESAVQIAPGLAARRMGAEHLRASGSNDPIGEMNGIYESLIPSEQEYNAEVAGFSGDFLNTMSKANYLEMIKEFSGGDESLYAELYDLADSGWEAQFEVLSRELNVDRLEFLSNFADSREAIPEFEPASRDQYFDRFVDSTGQEDQAAYNEALSRARAQILLGSFRS